jgi:hypothetical protein
MEQETPYVPPFIRRLMPNASEEQIIEASENLRAYLKLLYGIFLRKEAERLRTDSEESKPSARFGDGGHPPSTL